MARQGCRNHRLSTGICLAYAFFSLFSHLAASQADDSDVGTSDFRLQLTWKSDQPLLWSGEVSVAGGTDLTAEPGRLAEPGNFTPGMLLSGGIQLSEAGKQLRFAPPPSAKQLRDRRGQFVAMQTTRGGISFRASGRQGDRVLISFRRGDSNELSAPVAIEFKDLANGESIDSKLSETAMWSLRRVDGDRLRVKLVPDDGDLKPAQNLGTSLFWDDQKARVSIVTDRAINETLDLVCETVASNNRPVRCPSIVTCGFSIARMIRCVMSSRLCLNTECTDTTT